MPKTNDGYLKAIDFYLKQGIINISDVMSLGEEALVGKILNQVSSEQIYKLGDYWAVRVYDPTKPNKRRRIKRKNRRDLEKILLELHTAHQMTLASIYPEFMSYKSRLQAETTIKEYVKSYKKYYEGDPILTQDLRTLTVPDLEKWLRSKIEDAGGMNEKQYQKFSVVFSELLKYAFQQHYIDENPFERITRKRLGVTKFQRKPSTAEVFNTEELPLLMEAIREDYSRKPDPVPLAVKLAFQTGLRVGELVALKWGDVDFARMNGSVVMTRKKEEPGPSQRIHILSEYLDRRDLFGMYDKAKEYGCGQDDLIDAICLAVTASLHAHGQSETLPQKPEKDVNGLLMQLTVPIMRITN